MAGQITAIQVQKSNPRRANIYLDGRFAFGLAMIEAVKLSKGQCLSDEEIAALHATDERNKAHERALLFLSYRPRSKAEVTRRLIRQGFDKSVVSGEVERLSETGLLDDSAFAQYWISNREQFRPRGQYALRQELRQKGIDDTIIDGLLHQIDDTENAHRAAAPKLSSWHRLEPDVAYRKLSGYLGRRGFSYEAIQQVWERAQAERAGEMEPEESEDASIWDQ